MHDDAQIKKHINQFDDPFIGPNQCDFVQAITQFQYQDGHLQLVLCLPYPVDAVNQALTDAWIAHLKQLPQIRHIDLTLTWSIKGHTHANTAQAVPRVKNVIAVGSGKGGVGKSTTAVNLALALDRLGAQVGLLDADIYGPSVPTMLGAEHTQPESSAQKKLMPIVRHHIHTMSIGYLVDAKAAMAWRGPMASGALQQLLNDTNWPDLDYLIVDLPPGTGDIQLTMAQKIPVTAAMVVTTPQDLALIDAKRAVSLFNKVKIPVLGVLENMSTHVCSQCGHEEAIFASGGGLTLAQAMDVPLLGQMPLALSIREQTDSGTPTVAATHASSSLVQQYFKVALKASAQLAKLNQSDAHKFPKITVSQ